MPPVPRKDTIATYTWLADGTKLQVADSTGRGYVYVGSLVYSKDGNDLTLESTGFGGGRIVASEGPDGAGYTANYQLTDHLGSVRVVFESRKNVLARNDYYAFGKKHLNADLQTATGDINRWLYNGKEWQTTADVGFLDYGARMYDQEIGRWFNPDLLSEKYYPHSPYVFTGNNPVGYIDLHGLDWYSYMDYRYDDDGNIIGGTRQYEFRYGDADEELQSRPGFNYMGSTFTNGDYYYGYFGHVLHLDDPATRQVMESDMSMMKGYFSGLESPNKKTDAIGVTLASASFLTGATAELFFSETFDTWMGKDFKIRSQRWGGNQYTGGKFKFARQTSNYIKGIGSFVNVSTFVYTEYQYNIGEITNFERLTEHASGAISFGLTYVNPLFGLAWSFGWEAGKLYGPSKW